MQFQFLQVLFLFIAVDTKISNTQLITSVSLQLLHFSLTLSISLTLPFSDNLLVQMSAAYEKNLPVVSSVTVVY